MRREIGGPEVGMVVWPVCVVASVVLSPTTMRDEVWGKEEESIPDEEAMCDVAPVSRYQSAVGGDCCCCCIVMELRAWMSAPWSHAGAFGL